MLSSKEIREQFIDFFIKKSHIKVKSSSVVPNDDPTLLFANAGMNQFKDLFLGKSEIKIKRAVNSQKCIRAGGKHNDLEQVGEDGYHHTFFEMLGNWSFADYYKKEAIVWAWELFTEVWKLPKEKLYATVFEEDKESYDIWLKETDVEKSHLKYDVASHNFWEMGETGPCGPCSEIHIDMGESACNLKNDPNHVCKVNGDCDRFIELWNLVFISYYRDEKGNLNSLKNHFVDTGAGLERVCRVLQNVQSNYETDLFMPIINKIEELSGIKYDEGKNGVNHRVIADHVRALAFAIADGGIPSNEGRGYVLRRILRRAARYGHVLNLKNAFIYKLVDIVVKNMGEHYLELKEKQKFIEMIIRAEEERFNLTLDKGLQKFEEIIEKSEHNIISGRNVFLLYDTFGFPVDLTRVMAEERSYKIDYEGFSIEMQVQKDRARKANSFKIQDEKLDWNYLSKDKNELEFCGYGLSKIKTKICQFFFDSDKKIRIVLEKTPFYAEQGGQVSDIGRVYNEELEIKIYDVQKLGDKIVHFGKILKGDVTQDFVWAEINEKYRKKVARNHTTTHLLHAALKSVLGNHVQQKGSYVAEKSLRFDFTNIKALSEKELHDVEEIVNANIRKAIPVETVCSTLDEAKKDGAVALFGEKYEEKVRVVSVGNISKELCGGTHVKNIGEIGFFKIISESSVSAGVRRLEAVTGEFCQQYVDEMKDTLSELIKLFSTQPKMLIEKANKIIVENKNQQKIIQNLYQKLAMSSMEQNIKNALVINGNKVVIAKLDPMQSKNLKEISGLVLDKIESGICVLVSGVENKVNLLVAVSKDLTKKYQAGKIIKDLAEILGGKGGGKPELAMAGGKYVEKMDTLVDNVPQIIDKYSNM